ncbi:MAG: HipA family kinase, partial [Gemmatimonadaceae bacterium]
MARHAASRYIQPLREGGSLPAVVDTEDGGLFVVKFRGAGQGAKVLIAELVVGGIARTLGLPIPDLAVVDVSSRFGRSEPDPEIQELLRRSHGTNVGLRYLEGAFNFDPAAAGELVAPDLAARIVWLDAFTTNPDRTH